MINSIILYFRLICNIFIRIIVNELEIPVKRIPFGTIRREHTIVLFVTKGTKKKIKKRQIIKIKTMTMIMTNAANAALIPSHLISWFSAVTFLSANAAEVP